MGDRVQAAIVNLPVVSEFVQQMKKTNNELLHEPGRISGNQKSYFPTFAYTETRKRACIKSLGGGDTCSPSPDGRDTDDSEDTSSGKTLFIGRRNLALNRGGKDTESLT